MAVRIEDMKLGAVVRLLSGSPKMGVLGVSDGGLVECLWWSETLGVCTDKFPPELLTWPRRLTDDVPAAPVVASEGEDR